MLLVQKRAANWLAALLLGLLLLPALVSTPHAQTRYQVIHDDSLPLDERVHALVGEINDLVYQIKIAARRVCVDPLVYYSLVDAADEFRGDAFFGLGGFVVFGSKEGPSLKTAVEELDEAVGKLRICPPKSLFPLIFPLPGGLGVISLALPYLDFSLNASLGTSTASTTGTFGPFFSNSVQDAGSGNNTAKPSGTGFTGGFGASATLGELTNSFSGGSGGTNPITRYAPEAEKAYATPFPIKGPPQPRAPGITWGVDGNVYFFAGGDQKITDIPGGPFGTATGTDSFKISNNVMFTAGGWITAPITPAWSVSLTGGFAELNQTVKYSCSTFCAVAPATGAFTASQDKWVSGAYVGGRVTMPMAIAAFPGANIGIEYKHVFFDSYNVSLGTIATRQVNAKLSPDMDLVTLRLAIPIR